ncbi:MAG: hypothetical protein IJO63_03955 [Bacilli bacterium]|nr:hypothetical protein [Bacilli bacterium]
MKKILMILSLFLIVGCKQEKINEEVKYKYITNNYSYVNVQDSKENKNLEIQTEVLKEDYTKIDEVISRAVAYEIDLVKDEKLITNLNNSIKVGVIIPEDFSEENLKVYYVEDMVVKEKLDVTIEVVQNIKYATFITNHFSTYVLVEEKTEEEMKIEKEKEAESEVITKPSQNTATNNNSSSNNTVNNNNNQVNNNTPSGTNEPNFDAVPQHPVTIIPTAINVPEGAKIPTLPSFEHPFRAEISQTAPIHAEVDFSYCQIGVLCHVYYNYEDNWYGEPVKQLPSNFTYTLEAVQ